MKIAIVGPGGFIGSNLAGFLKKEGAEVCPFSSSDRTGVDPESGLLPEGFSIPEKTDSVVYLAQSPHYRNVPGMAGHLMAVNVASTIKAAEAARRAKVARFIYASTGNVYAPSFEPLAEDSPLRRDGWYPLSKIHAEEALSLFRNDMQVTSVRLFGVYGPGQTDKMVPNLFDGVLHGKPVSLDRNPFDEDDLDGLRISLCYIDDLVRVLFRLCEVGGPPALNVAGNGAASIRSIASLISRRLGKEVNFIVTEKNRPFDLIADITLLKDSIAPDFTEISDGIGKTVEYEVSRRT